MADQTIVAFQDKGFSAEKKRSDDIQIPDDAVELLVSATRESWIDTGVEVIFVNVDLSLDNGKTWIKHYVGFGAPGGSPKDKDGNVHAVGGVMRQLLPGKNRLARVNVDSKVDLTSEIKLTTR